MINLAVTEFRSYYFLPRTKSCYFTIKYRPQVDSFGEIYIGAWRRAEGDMKVVSCD